MASLVHALKSFQSGSLSKEELFAEVDQILQGGRANEAWLLETLKEENTKIPLPEDVHEQVQDRIEKSAAVKSRTQSGETHGGVEGQVTDIEIQAKEIVRLRAELNNILVDHTGQTLETIEKDTERDFWMTADEAKGYGVIDEVLMPRRLASVGS